MTVHAMNARAARVMPNEITGRHVLFAMIGFFALIIATDAYLVYKAVSTFGGIETDDAYRKGLAYNARIADERAQAARGWTSEAALDPAKSELVVTVRDSEGKGVESLEITALLGRPATNAEDRTLKLTQVGSGRYATAVGPLGPGTWVVTMEAREGPGGRDRVVYQSKVRLWKEP